MSDNELLDLPGLSEVSLAPAHGIAALALNFALKFWDIATVQDGTLYQQYKLEGRNMKPIELTDVLDVARRIEVHMLSSSQRIAGLVIDAIAYEDRDFQDLPDGMTISEKPRADEDDEGGSL